MTTVRPWVEFDAVVEPLAWGRNTYTVLRLDAALERAARELRTRRVEGTIDQTSVNLGMNRAGVITDAFAYVGRGLQRRLEVRAGAVVRCRLRPADPDDVPLPDDLHRALADAGRLDSFESQPSAERRRLLQPVDDAVKAETRRRRIDALVRSVSPQSPAPTTTNLPPLSGEE